MNHKIAIIPMPYDLHGVMLDGYRKSGKPQIYHTMIHATSKKELNEWLEYFVKEAQKIYNDPTYENEEMVKIKTNN